MNDNRNIITEREENVIQKLNTTKKVTTAATIRTQKKRKQQFQPN